MSKYFLFLNWMMSLALISIYVLLKPIFGWSVVFGAILGGMLTAGLCSWQYYKDVKRNPTKEQLWMFHFFGKTYLLEIASSAMATLLFLLLSLIGWRPLFYCLSTTCLMLLINNVLECFWRYTIHPKIINKWLKNRK